MDKQHLVQMSNRIAQFFQAMPDVAEAEEGVVNHLAKFWPPAMRQALLQHVAEGGEGLLPLVQQALQQHGGRLLPYSPAG